jgi:hypothetical protein
MHKDKYPYPQRWGTQIQAIAVYQSTKILLMDNGTQVLQPSTALIRGKEALMRIFIHANKTSEPLELKAKIVFEHNGTMTAQEKPLRANGSSEEENLDTTFNIEIPEGFLSTDLRYRVTLYQSELAIHHWPESDETSALYSEDTNGAFELFIVPLAYTADQSGQLPDISDSQIDFLQDLFVRLYPVADITITVQEPLAWDTPVQPRGIVYWGPVSEIDR